MHKIHILTNVFLDQKGFTVIVDNHIEEIIDYGTVNKNNIKKCNEWGTMQHGVSGRFSLQNIPVKYLYRNLKYFWIYCGLDF